MDWLRLIYVEAASGQKVWQLVLSGMHFGPQTRDSSHSCHANGNLSQSSLLWGHAAWLASCTWRLSSLLTLGTPELFLGRSPPMGILPRSSCPRSTMSGRRMSGRSSLLSTQMICILLYWSIISGEWEASYRSALSHCLVLCHSTWTVYIQCLHIDDAGVKIHRWCILEISGEWESGCYVP